MNQYDLVIYVEGSVEGERRYSLKDIINRENTYLSNSMAEFIQLYQIVVKYL